MGKRDLLALPQLHEQVRVIATGVDLFHAQHGGYVRHAPGMDVEHRRDRHVDIAVAHQSHAVQAADHAGHRQGMQHQLAVGEVHALGIAGGARGVESRGHRVFIEVREVVLRARLGQQAFVLADHVR
ncbi:hypothetical protein D3C77_488680 [compost metagenome]